MQFHGYSNNTPGQIKTHGFGSIPLHLLGCTPSAAATVKTDAPAAPAKKAVTDPNAPISRAELLKYHIAIDRELLRNHAKKNGAVAGLGAEDFKQVDAALTNILTADLTDEDVNDLLQLEGLGKTAVGNFISKAGQTVKKVVNKAVDGVKRAVTLPARGVIEAALKVFKGKTSGLFAYALIADGSPILAKNRIVALKRERQRRFLDLLEKGAQFSKGYLYKHLLNNLQDHYKMTPEQFVIKLSKNQLSGTEMGLGFDPATIATVTAALVPVIAIVPEIIKAFKPKDDAPSESDFTNTPPPTDDDFNDASGDPKFNSGILQIIQNHPIASAAAGIGIAGAITGIIYMVRGQKKKGKRKR